MSDDYVRLINALKQTEIDTINFRIENDENMSPDTINSLL